jgi:sporulation protein YlmC with PRC-barrel domain
MTEKKGEFVPAQKFIGMQVIDSKGSAVGTVKDLGVNVTEKEFNLIVATKASSEIQLSWGDIQSVLDVVLLRKEIELPKTTEHGLPPPPPMSNCPKCGTQLDDEPVIPGEPFIFNQLPDIDGFYNKRPSLKEKVLGKNIK